MEKKKQNALLAIMGVIILVQLIIGIMTISKDYPLITIVSQIPLVFIALYGFWLYKKPHGNMLKYAMLILAVSDIFIYISLIRGGFDTSYTATVMVFALCILIYVSGRLNRIEQNKYLLSIAILIQFASRFVDAAINSTHFTFMSLCSWFGPPVATIALLIAYLVRYKEHKEAGISDK